MVWAWRNETTFVDLSADRRRVPWNEHERWWRMVMGSKEHLLFIIGPDAGVVRVERDDHKRWQAEISISVLPEHQGKGFGARAIDLASRAAFKEWDDVSEIWAIVRMDNVRSQRVFAKVGFEEDEPRHGGQWGSLPEMMFMVRRRG